MTAEGRDPAGAGSSSSAETRAPFWGQGVGRLCPEAFREGGGRWGREPPGAQGLNGGPGGVARPGVHAHCDRSPGLFSVILHKKLERYTVYSKYSKMIVAVVLTILLNV